jgi:hypothetical protein
MPRLTMLYIIHNIEQGVILMCTPDLYFQKFVINGARFRQAKWEWLERVDKYYRNKVTILMTFKDLETRRQYETKYRKKKSR